ncbi:MAG: TolC family protein [Gemmataceae bacterium]
MTHRLTHCGLVMLLLSLGVCPGAAGAADPVPPVLARPPQADVIPAPEPCDRALPITLQAALQLAGVAPLDIGLAAARVRVAVAQLDQSRYLWLPSIQVGVDYFRHDGQIQDIRGYVFPTSRSAIMAGAGPNLVFATSDAVFGPLARLQGVRAGEARLQAAQNDALMAVAEAYFDVQQARGELVGALAVAYKADELVDRATKLAETLVPPVEVVRARTERARRRQQVERARERWRTASAELVRLLRLDPAAVVEPAEPPHLLVTLVQPGQKLDDLVAIALLHRPELAAQKALVQATLYQLRQEKLRPLMPSVLIRGAATNPAGTLAGGVFGGGVNSQIGNFAARNSVDVQVLWEVQNLGLGNLARVRERRAENDQATLELFRTQDRVAAETVRAHAEVQAAARRVVDAEEGLRDAADSVQKNFEGLRQTRTAGTVILLVIRPQEAVASVQALAQAYTDFYQAVGDYDRAQFRLYRALGQPAHLLGAGGILAEQEGNHKDHEEHKEREEKREERTIRE